MKAADVRVGDFIELPNHEDVEIVDISRSDGNDDGLATITITYRAYHEWSWEASKHLASRGIKGARLIAYPEGLDRQLAPLRSDDQLVVVPRPLRLASS